LRERLQELAPIDSDDLRAAWEVAAHSALEVTPPREIDGMPEQFLILITCRDEWHQVELLDRYRGEGLECKALLS
jgi:hypothetical protein